MRKLFWIITVPLSLLLFLFFACDMPDKEYRFSVEYFNGEKDTVSYVGKGENRFFLKGGDLTLYRGQDPKVIASGIRRFDVLSMAELAVQKDTIKK